VFTIPWDVGFCVLSGVGLHFPSRGHGSPFDPDEAPDVVGEIGDADLVGGTFDADDVDKETGLCSEPLRRSVGSKVPSVPIQFTLPTG
jgi:hypothetical protein